MHFHHHLHHACVIAHHAAGRTLHHAALMALHLRAAAMLTGGKRGQRHQSRGNGSSGQREGTFHDFHLSGFCFYTKHMAALGRATTPLLNPVCIVVSQPAQLIQRDTKKPGFVPRRGL